MCTFPLINWVFCESAVCICSKIDRSQILHSAKNHRFIHSLRNIKQFKSKFMWRRRMNWIFKGNSSCVSISTSVNNMLLFYLCTTLPYNRLSLEPMKQKPRLLSLGHFPKWTEYYDQINKNMFNKTSISFYVFQSLCIQIICKKHHH